MKDEEWKILKGFKRVIDNIYEVSNYGDVREISTGYILHKKIANKKYHPYHAVYISTNTVKEWVLVHQLVAHCFLEIPEKYIGKDVELVPDHLDNNGLNNYYKNLELKTRGENTSDAWKNGCMENRYGENNPQAIITNDEAHRICQLISENKSYQEILELMRFPDTHKYRTQLVRIKNKIAWTHISDQYEFPISWKDKQKEFLNKVPLILKMFSDGYSNAEICDNIWPDIENRQARLLRIGRLRRKYYPK